MLVEPTSPISCKSTIYKTPVFPFIPSTSSGTSPIVPSSPSSWDTFRLHSSFESSQPQLPLTLAISLPSAYIDKLLDPTPPATGPPHQLPLPSSHRPNRSRRTTSFITQTPSMRRCYPHVWTNFSFISTMACITTSLWGWIRRHNSTSWLKALTLAYSIGGRLTFFVFNMLKFIPWWL